MGAGIQELLLLIIIVMAIVLLPRMTATGKGRSAPRHAVRLRLSAFTGRQRLAILLSVLWPAAIALYLSPWRNGWQKFMVVGAGPVAVVWGAVWVIAGFRCRRKP